MSQYTLKGRDFSANKNYFLIVGACYKCGGSGSYTWTTRRGPQSGTCFTCEGAGQIGQYSPTEEHANRLAQAATKRAARKAAKAKAALQAACLDNPWVYGVALFLSANASNKYTYLCAQSILRQACEGKEITYKQRIALTRIVLGTCLRNQAKASNVPVPEGKTQVTGTIVKISWRENAFGGSWKMLVKCAGFKLWGTVPSKLLPDNPEELTGKSISFTGKLSRSNDDPSFGFISGRTSKPTLV